jgi:hypothetical protein
MKGTFGRKSRKMLERLLHSVNTRPNNVALTAMDTALRQQKDFKETATEIRDRQEQAKAERHEKMRNEELQERQNSEHSSDLLVRGLSDTEDEGGTQSDQRGSAVDVEI